MKMTYQEFRNNFAPNGSVECVVRSLSPAVLPSRPALCSSSRS